MRSCRDNHGVRCLSLPQSRHADRAYGASLHLRQTELSEPGGGECGRYGDPVPEELNFDEGPERRALRAAVTDLGSKYGQSYFLEQARSGGNTDQLWAEAGKLGFLGVNLPEEYGGGGGRGVRSWRGVARLALARASDYARTRTVWSAPICFQGLTHPLAACQVEIEMAALMTQKAAWLIDQGQAEAAGTARTSPSTPLPRRPCTPSIRQFKSMAVTGCPRSTALPRFSRCREMILSAIAQHGLRLPSSY